MNTDDLNARAKSAALAAVLNLLLKHLGPDAADAVRAELLDEVDRISDGNPAIRTEALGFIDKAVTSLG